MNNANSAPRIAVVGAGLAGLSAAVALKKGGAHVEIFERMRFPGGKATSFTVEGVEVDNGQHVVLECCTAFVSFLDELGMRSTLWMQPRFDVTVLSRARKPARLFATPLAAPLHLAGSFLRYPHLSFADKIRIARALFAARRPAGQQETMAGWLRRHHQGARARRTFWDPFLVPAVNAPLERVAAEDGLFVIRTAFLSSRDAARIGFSTVPLVRMAEAAAARADALHLRAAVTGLVLDGNRASALRLDGATSRRQFDGFVLAVPPQRLQAIIGDGDGFGIGDLGVFATEPIVDVHLWYALPEKRRLLGASRFAAVLDSPVQWVFEKAPGYLCCSLSAASDVIGLPERVLAERCHAELTSVLPSLRGLEPARVAATRDPDATFVPAVGLRRPGAQTGIPNVVIAGAWTGTGWPATMESAVRSGQTAAECLLHALHQRAGAGSVESAPRQELAHAV